MYSWRVRLIFWVAVMAVLVLVYSGVLISAAGAGEADPVVGSTHAVAPTPKKPVKIALNESTRAGWTEDDVQRVEPLVSWAARGKKAEYKEYFAVGKPMENAPEHVAVVVLVGDPSKGEPKIDHGYLDALGVMAMNVFRHAPGFTPVVLMGPALYETPWKAKVERLGWLTYPSPIPVTHSDIAYKPFADALFKTNDSKEFCDDTCRAIYGGVGPWELAKLEAWRFPTRLPGGPYTHVMLLDLDINLRGDITKIFTEWLPESATLGFTLGAYDGIGGEPLNGGFQVLKLSEDSEKDYHEMMSIVKRGGWRKGQGWGDGFGSNYGGFNQQGLLPYYYMNMGGRGRAGLLPRCILNNMAMRPGCKDVPQTSVLSNHFTGDCHKPWQCVPIDKYHPQCQLFHARWWNDSNHLQSLLRLPTRCPTAPTLSLHGAAICCPHTSRWPYMYDEINFEANSEKLTQGLVENYFESL